MGLRNHLRKILCAALTGAALSSGAALASDHRESPEAAAHPGSDITDYYAFVNPNDPSKLVFVLTVNPASIPSIARTYVMDSRSRFVFHIDNNGDYRDDAKIVFRFSKEEFPPSVPGVGIVPGQVYNARFTIGSDSFNVEGEVTPFSQQFPEPPAPIITESHGVKVFVGPCNDPFFFDSVDSFRVLAKVQPKFQSAQDRNWGSNVHAIVVEMPSRMIYKNKPLNTWTATEELNRAGEWKQVQRQGNPALKAVFIPEKLRYKFNTTHPKDDPRNFRAVIADQLVEVFNVQPPDIARYLKLTVPDTLLLDPTKPVKLGQNGRTLDDDIDLMFWFNLDKPLAYAPGQLDGVPANDVPSRSVFPYVAPPTSVPN
ncbi:DUF4331 domain-containing protein [Tahibacter amnicola]|uniref:DUF4331 domain-containing protein n=1 Tax=Tahibacter amnicola TaxID=2976241 RepID=A0ABY6BHX3_9GAMM|nr:DUF4331 domain-containing protein [Tahibacter amnicola]UXI69479.1 DUF4331 domain-containing protein [Tahibacter amnicola]